MSRAFTKEDDSSDDLPERPVSDRPNYVTPAGLAALRRRHDELTRKREELLARKVSDTEPERKSVERDLRYVEIRLAGAILVDPAKSEAGVVRFGARVTLSDGAAERVWQIVGEDEADLEQGKVSWSSPLALSLMGAKPGDEVDSPVGRLKVVRVAYDSGP